MRKLWKPALILAAVLAMAIGMLGSGAWFTDSATSSDTTLTSGTLSISDGALSTTVLGTIPAMAPGDKTGDAVIVIENNGTLPLAWFGDLVVSDSMLKDAIYIDTAKMEFLSPSGRPNWEATDTFIANGIGYLTVANTFATLAAFDGNPSMVPGTPYEFMGALKPGYKYQLTLKFGFREDAGNTYQGAGPISISFKADATQIKAGALEALHGTLSNHVTWLNLQIAKQP